MLHRPPTRAALAITLAAAALVGCAPAAEPMATVTTAATSTASKPAAGDATPTPEPTPLPEQKCRYMHETGPHVGGELDLHPFKFRRDNGPREGANGTATYDDDGLPMSYTVASGDHEEAIMYRFCIGAYQLAAANTVRRGSLFSDDPTHQAYLTKLYVGDVLNLSPYTISSVGSVNGEVRSWEPTFSLPPQR